MSLHPAATLALRAEVHGLRLADTADLWYLGGGAFQDSTFGYQGRPSTGSRSLSTVWDLSATYPVTRALSATLYFARASGLETISGPSNRRGTLAYVETTVHF